MPNLTEITQFCRLCLVKNNVNIPIFEDQSENGQIFVKISSCLPVTVTRDDDLPKNICSECANKLDVAYEFRKSTVVAEKQLRQWIDDINIKNLNDSSKEADDNQIIKEEPDDSFVAIPETITYESDKGSSSKTRKSGGSEPPPKRARRAAAMKRPVNIPSESDEDVDDVEPLLTKTEDSDSELDTEDHDPTFEDIPPTNVDQPGPSGVGKEGVDFVPSSIQIKLEEPDNHEEQIVITVVVDSDDEKFDPDKRMKNSKYSCNICGEFIERSRISFHEKLIHGIFKCKICLANFGNDADLRSHKLVHNEKKTIDMIEDSKNQTIKRRTLCRTRCLCDVCGKMILTSQILSHLKSHGIFKCVLCKQIFKNDEELHEHQKVEQSGTFQCMICQDIFNTLQSFTLHNFKHNNLYICPLCEFTTEVRQSIICHIMRHEGKFKWVCQICNKGFLTRATLSLHEELHLDIKKYTCKFCNKKFSVKRYLTTHMKLNHAKELFGVEDKYICEVCNRKFTFEKSLVRHLSVIHKIGDDRTVPCPICKKRIANPYNLKLHMRVHTGEKNYVCHLCGKAFSGLKYLKKHNESHKKRTIKDNIIV